MILKHCAGVLAVLLLAGVAACSSPPAAPVPSPTTDAPAPADQKRAEALVQQARRDLRSREYPAASAALTQAVEAAPHRLDARLMLAWLRAGAGDFEQAIAQVMFVRQHAAAGSIEAKAAQEFQGLFRDEVRLAAWRLGVAGVDPRWMVFGPYPLTAAGAMCITVEGLRVPVRAENAHCAAFTSADRRFLQACGNTQYGSPGRTVQLIVAPSSTTCDRLGFRGEAVSAAEIEQALQMLDEPLPPELANAFRALPR